MSLISDTLRGDVRSVEIIADARDGRFATDVLLRSGSRPDEPVVVRSGEKDPARARERAERLARERLSGEWTVADWRRWSR